ncbi:MAG TPA: hypothetical protein PLP72_01910 [Leptospiraceae bacterium]|nr:hypothetical protein [Leptospiraceae bacterium]HMW05942.1 hypothetical protein [Leptospiraceae bacterium]HNA05734.1 hypothetical protein [Leptospiraceae bacterium]HNF55300.1 hypothetical protein [Leptospiraceae bacterium]HNG98281.1 hypothetical protein [Leptospiraceae bacterium]
MTQIIKILIISLLCISFCNLNALHNKKQEKKTKSAPKKKLYDCKNYHQGKFTYTDINGLKILIIRENEIQYLYREYPNAYKKKSIVWLTDCKYKSTVIEIHDPILDDSMLGKENIVEITKNRNKDWYEYSNSENDVLNTGIVYVVKD